MSFVVDTSVALAWCFADEQTDANMALLDRVVETGTSAPQLWPIEALNGLLAAERRGRIDEQTASRLWTSTAQLAKAHGLTAYDATYLELAVRLGLPLATGDTALMVAAKAVGVPLLPTA